MIQDEADTTEADRDVRPNRSTIIRATAVPSAIRDAPAGASLADRLRASSEGALTKLTSVPGLSRHEALYSRPWYLVLGQEATVRDLLESGLGEHDTVPRPDPDPRSWAWWPMQKIAAIAPGPGLVRLKDEDREGWVGLETALGQLVKLRPRLPLNGIVVTLSVSDLMSGTVQIQAQRMRAVINECYRSLRADFPVHLIVTGLAGLPGFGGFMAPLSAVGGQVIGHVAATPVQIDHAEPVLGGFLDQILVRLEQIRLGMLADLEADLDRAGVFAFPESLRALVPHLLPVAERLLGSDAYGHRIHWRSLFFAAPEAVGGPRLTRDIFDRFLPQDAGLVQP
ncbi:MAG: hypothetical protein RLY86_43 [Pseudomonadota bacterium]